MRKTLVTGLATLGAIAGWAIPASAGLFATTGPVIAIVAGELFLGEAKRNLDRSGTFGIQSRAKPELTCRGQYTKDAGSGGTGNMLCSDGTAGTFQFQFQSLSLMSGYGTGNSSRGSISFTYGLSANESEPYLKLPPGKALRPGGNDLVLMKLRQPVLANLPVTGPNTSGPETAPDALLRAATLVGIANINQDRNLLAYGSAKSPELVESAILPLFDFQHMTLLAVARDWRLATPNQQDALVAEFKTLLLRIYSTVLANYRDQTIEYKTLRMAPGEIAVTVRSTVKQPGAERTSIDYDMEKTTAGWKVIDIKIAGVSLITTYRSTFAQAIREGGVDGLITSLAAKNRQADIGLSSQESGAWPIVFTYSVIRIFVGGER
jgi:phospholipid transport system substrate-binding protein